MSSPSVALFAATVFASAFLIFFVQPMVGKPDWMILSRDAGYIELFPPLAERIRAMLKVKPVALRVSYARDVNLADAPLWTDDYSDLLSVLKTPSWKRVWAGVEPPDEGDEG
jgi:hypothetical protein